MERFTLGILGISSRCKSAESTESRLRHRLLSLWAMTLLDFGDGLFAALQAVEGLILRLC